MLWLVAILNLGGCKLNVSNDGGDAGSSSQGDEDDDRNATGGRDGGSPGASGGTPEAAGGTPEAAGGTPAAAGGSASESGGSVATGGEDSSTSTAPAHFEDCGASETTANDDRDSARALGAEATFCVDQSSDRDWFYVETPDDGKAHVIQLDFDQSARAYVAFEVYAAKDFSNMGGLTLGRGAKETVFVSVGPGTRTLFEFRSYVGASEGPISVRTSVTAERDQYEPNNDRGAAAEISAGAPISAQLIVPYSASDDRSPADWYKLELGAGEHVFKVGSSPQEVYFGVEIYDGDGVNILKETAPNKGAIFGTNFEVDEAGTYYFGVYQYIATLPVISNGEKPKFLSEQYTFQID
jgi:hypothetical protein